MTGGLERRDAVDAFAHVEREVELAAAQLLDPLAVLVDRDVADLVPLGDERLLDRLDGAEDELVGLGRVARTRRRRGWRSSCDRRGRGDA